MYQIIRVAFLIFAFIFGSHDRKIENVSPAIVADGRLV